MQSLNHSPHLVQTTDLEQELLLSVDSDVRDYWDKKIKEGIVPTETKQRGLVNMDAHWKEMEKLAEFEASVVRKLFDGEWKTPKSSLIQEMHYFGIGTSEGLKRVAEIANENQHRVIAYDTSSVAGENGKLALDRSKGNQVLLADIEFACSNKYIPKGKATKLIASRVLDILDKQDSDWKRKAKHQRKMAKTARKIGSLLSFLDVLIIHPCAEDNLKAIWGDTTPHRLGEVVGYMRSGLGKEVQLKRLGTVNFHNHIYTAALIRRAS